MESLVTEQFSRARARARARARSRPGGERERKKEKGQKGMVKTPRHLTSEEGRWARGVASKGRLPFIPPAKEGVERGEALSLYDRQA
ncbi:hypothetical protein H6P81_008240 [Aristolochia fimbriata]|uniref:Uncharacterized protein n=1 Tax=Aristolochia fimbriata TaxID=158543 RepID=A0AAV7F5C4_ARIFI|nr:hypothetical protein H6P81_008240 [Aristolochia fimbriata]